MGQVTIYLNNETEMKMNTIIKASGISKSRWVSDIIKEKTDRSWPDYIRNLAGAWKELQETDQLRKTLGTDVKRDLL